MPLVDKLGNDSGQKVMAAAAGLQDLDLKVLNKPGSPTVAFLVPLASVGLVFCG